MPLPTTHQYHRPHTRATTYNLLAWRSACWFFSVNNAYTPGFRRWHGRGACVPPHAGMLRRRTCFAIAYYAAEGHHSVYCSFAVHRYHLHLVSDYRFLTHNRYRTFIRGEHRRTADMNDDIARLHLRLTPFDPSRRACYYTCKTGQLRTLPAPAPTCHTCSILLPTPPRYRSLPLPPATFFTHGFYRLRAAWHIAPPTSAPLHAQLPARDDACDIAGLRACSPSPHLPPPAVYHRPACYLSPARRTRGRRLSRFVACGRTA